MKTRLSLAAPGLMLAAGLLCGSALGQDNAIDPATAEGYVQLNRKIHCSLEDSSPQVYQWFGRTWSRVPGERDRHLFNLDGMNIRQCVAIEDPVRGVGYRMVSREIMLYLDPETNEVLRTHSPIPGPAPKTMSIHVANDPVNGRPTFGRTPDGDVQLPSNSMT